MPNKATPIAVQKHTAMFSNIKYNPLGDTNLQCSQAGFGSYRIHLSISEHREALEHALASGINLIDTSANYGDGGSEQLIGQVLKNLVSTKKIKREALIIVSKAGYIQGENFKESQLRKEKNTPWPD